MKWIKFIVHPHAYIFFFITISLLALIPNGLGWRGDMMDYTQNYIGLSLLYVLFYFLGYYFTVGIITPKKRDTDVSMVNLFHFVYFVCFGFFIIKFLYIGGIPLINDAPYLRTKMGQLGGFVDFPAKAMALLGIVAYYFYIKRKNLLCFIQLFVALALNILFAERSLIIFTLIGALILYLHHYTISAKTFRMVVISGFLMLFLIGWVQIVRLGGKDNLDRSGKKSAVEVAAWVIHGDLTGSQKFGAYITDRLGGESLYGRYTFGTYLALIIPSYEDHGAEYLQEEFTNAKTAQSAAIPFSYYMDFGYFSLLFPFLIGGISKFFYFKFKSLNSPLYTLIYPAFFFNLLWSVRAGNFPIDPKFVYFILVLIFIFKPTFKLRLNNELTSVVRFLFLCTLAVSFLALILRW